MVLLALGGIVYLYRNDPAVSPSWPCAVLSVTGLQCAGCGGQRAVHALLHGHLRAAFFFNPWMVAVLLPFGTLLGLRAFAARVWGLPAWRPGRWYWIGLAFSGFVYMVGRNLF